MSAPRVARGRSRATLSHSLRAAFIISSKAANESGSRILENAACVTAPSALELESVKVVSLFSMAGGSSRICAAARTAASTARAQCARGGVMFTAIRVPCTLASRAR